MTWTRDRFSRRRYTVEGDDLDKAKKIEVIVKLDGRTVVHVQAREPGMVAVVSRPTEQGFDVDMVEPVGARFVDHAVAPISDQVVADWQFEALGL